MSKQSLPGSRLNAFAMDPSALVIVGLDTDDGPEHPLYDERIKLEVPDALVLNIKRYGVKLPVLVRKDDAAAVVIDGRQRVRAARLANAMLRSEGGEPLLVRVMAERASDAEVAGIMISTNENRIEDQVSTKIKKLERFMGLGRSELDAAVAFGVTPSTIRNWLAVLEAGPEIKKALNAGRISASAAATMGKLPREKQAAALEETVAAGGTAAKAGRVARNAARSASETKYDPPTKRVMRKLLESEDIDLGGARAVLRWVLGEGPSARVPGLNAALRELGETSSEEG